MSMDEMIQGYWDGKDDDRMELPKGHNFSPSYEHGWLNGRDDRIHKPRERASVLRARADMILNNTTPLTDDCSLTILTTGD